MVAGGISQVISGHLNTLYGGEGSLSGGVGGDGTHTVMLRLTVDC